MYLAYVNLQTKNGETVFAIFGNDSEDIYQNALKFGSDPYFVSGMYQLNEDW